MPFLPSLYRDAGEGMRDWSVPWAAGCGALIGAVAAAFKMLGPLREAPSLGLSVREIAVAALTFALLCAFAAAVRNLIARRLIWRDHG